MASYDVYAYGVVSSSTLYGIRGAFPAAEGYAEIDQAQRMTGGEATNSSIVLSRLGATVKLDGNWLGADENGERTMAFRVNIDSCEGPDAAGYRKITGNQIFETRGTEYERHWELVSSSEGIAANHYIRLAGSDDPYEWHSFYGISPRQSEEEWPPSQ